MQAAPGTSLNGADEVSGPAVPQTPEARSSEARSSEAQSSEARAATGGGRHAGAPGRPRRIGLLVGVAVFVIAADVISKSIVVAKMAGHPPIRLLGGLLTITLTRNGGAAFSIGTSMTVVFTAIAVGVIVYILRAARNLRSIGWAIALGLLLGGATGNLLDRIFRAPAALQGHVVDWIELPHWPVFNLADSSIVCAGVLVVLLALRGIRLDGTKAVAPDNPAPRATATQSRAAEPRATDATGDER